MCGWCDLTPSSYMFTLSTEWCDRSSYILSSAWVLQKQLYLFLTLDAFRGVKRFPLETLVK